MLVAIGGYSINCYWWLFYSWLLTVFLFMIIGGYFLMAINIYWWLLVVNLLVVIVGYYIINHWWLYY
jgi:hypothetical protein